MDQIMKGFWVNFSMLEKLAKLIYIWASMNKKWTGGQHCYFPVLRETDFITCIKKNKACFLTKFNKLQSIWNSIRCSSSRFYHLELLTLILKTAIEYILENEDDWIRESYERIFFVPSHPIRSPDLYIVLNQFQS